MSQAASNVSERHSISVIIPAYNRAELIGETLRTLWNQTVQAKEIIVVDDGSTDGTAEAVEREFSVFREQFSASHKPSSVVKPSLRVIRQQNAGPGAARNRGLAEATGEFIHFFDSDDIASPNKHEVQLRALLETGANIAYGPWVKGRFAPKQAQTVARPLAHGVARGSLPLAAQTARVAGATEATELRVASLNSVNTRYQLPATLYSGFTPEGPVLQARGLPKGDLIKALLTNWSVVPHACLFRRSILEKVGGFPEDIWVGEDQLLFLKCLLAGAKVVHTPETLVFYRLGNDPGKLTATGAAQKRHARDWARFLVKANEEVSSAETTGAWGCAGKPAKGSPKGESRGSDQGNRVTRVEEKNSTTNHTNLHERGEKVSTTIERQGGRENRKLGKAEGRATESWPQRGAASGTMQVIEQSKFGPKGEGVGMTKSNDSDIHGFLKSQQGDAQGTCAGASEPDSLPSELVDSPVSESLTRSASGPAEALSADNAGIGSAGGNQLADSKEVLEGQTQAGLQMDSQKLQSIRMANDTSASKGDSSSVPIRDIRGSNFYILDSSTPPSAWFGFRLRAYEAWRDLEKFFPDGEDELKNELQGIWKINSFSGFRFHVSGFAFRKLGGLKLRVLGYREHASFRCSKFSSFIDFDGE